MGARPRFSASVRPFPDSRIGTHEDQCTLAATQMVWPMLRYHTCVTTHLDRTPLFEGLSPEQLDAVAKRMRPHRFAPGEDICRAGEPGNSLFVVEGGLAHVLVPGAPAPIARLRRGDVIGEMSLVTG